MTPRAGQLIAETPTSGDQSENAPDTLEIIEVWRKYIVYRSLSDGQEGLISKIDLRLYEEVLPAKPRLFKKGRFQRLKEVWNGIYGFFRRLAGSGRD